MILVDTSVWADHIRRGDAGMRAKLQEGLVRMHPYVIGEIALASPKNRAQWLDDLQLLPQVAVAEHDEVLGLIERQRLFGGGIGYVDAHLLASTLLTPGVALWTRDRRLSAVARRLGLESVE